MSETEHTTVGDWVGADFFDPNFRDDPYPKLAHLRENDPVNLTPVGTWRISRYEDVKAIFNDAPTSMTDKTAIARISIHWIQKAVSLSSC